MYDFYYLLLVGSKRDRNEFINNFTSKLIIPRHIHDNFIMNAILYKVGNTNIIYNVIEVDIDEFNDNILLNNVNNAIILYNNIDDEIRYKNLICKLKSDLIIVSVHINDYNKAFQYMKYELNHCTISLKNPIFIDIPLLLLSSLLIDEININIYGNKHYCDYINNMSTSFKLIK